MIVSESFARANDLIVGSYFEIEYIQVNYNDVHGAFDWPAMLVENYFSSLTHTVQVVGLFEVVGDLGVGNEFNDETVMEQMLNRIYLPTVLVEEFLDFQREQYLEVVGTLSDLPEETFLEPLFLLEDPNDLAAFAEEANDILPEFWYIVDLSSNFAHLRNSMNGVLEIADMVLYVTIVASVLVLGLLIILFLHDRKHEIGIYLALGEKRFKVLGQLLIEVLLVAVVAISLSVFVGSILSEQISQYMVEQNLHDQAHEQLMSGGGGLVPVSMQMFDTGEMTVDEMMAAYDTSLNGETIFILFVVGIGSVILSASLPMSYLLRLNPKKVLM
ncbi:MAG: ABC transporter permease [Defluviitaleaceae bacterium]|nr:ABC transporter permease [Defluviitaleaceae bacterium]